MTRKTVSLLPSTQKSLKKLGANIKNARLRRNIHADLLAEQAGISTDTLSAIEKGCFTVSIGAYAAVLAVLGLDADLQLVAVDEKGKEEFGQNNLQRRLRATRRMNNGGSSDGRESDYGNH